MLSIKHVLAAAVLGVSLLAAPATLDAKVLHPTKKMHSMKSHAKKLHRKHGKHVALHAGHTKAKSMAAGSGWKHHHSL
jgi:hypothetical protein